MKDYKLSKWERYTLSIIFIAHMVTAVLYTKTSVYHNLTLFALGVLLAVYFLRLVGRALFYVYSTFIIPSVAFRLQYLPAMTVSQSIIMLLFLLAAFVSFCFIFYLHMKHRRDVTHKKQNVKAKRKN